MSNQQNKILTRVSRPISFAGALGGLMRIFGIHASAGDLTARWDEIMGDKIASVAQIVAIKQTRDKKFNIVLRPHNPAMALELSYMNDEILNKINKYFGYNAVSKITLRK